MECTGTFIKDLIELVEAHKISVKSALELAHAEGRVAELRDTVEQLRQVVNGNESKT